MTTPPASRPYAPEYGIPATTDGTLSWEHVDSRLTQARNFWIVTVEADCSPHAVPIWGAWVDGVLYVGGVPTARWVRNLRANPNVLVHLEDGDDVVILKGLIYEEKDPGLIERADAVYYGTKYGGSPPENDPDGGWLALRPHTVLAWSAFPKDATRWTFPATGAVTGAP